MGPSLHLGGHQPVDEGPVVERDGDGLGALDILIQQTVVFLLLIIVQAAVVGCMVRVKPFIERLIEHPFNLIDAFAKDGGAESKCGHVAFAAFHVICAHNGDVVEDGTFLVPERFGAKEVGVAFKPGDALARVGCRRLVHQAPTLKLHADDGVAQLGVVFVLVLLDQP